MKKKLNDIIELTDEKPQDEPWTYLPEGGILFVRRPSDAEIANIYQLTQTEITSSSASLPVIETVHKHNKDSFWGVYQASDSTKQDARLIGYYSFLHLNQMGRDKLENGTFDATVPDLDLLVLSGQRPAAMYVWALVARKVARMATPLVAWALGAKLYGGVALYATAGTLGGLNTMKGYGFSGARPSDAGLGHLFRLDPQARKVSEAA